LLPGSACPHYDGDEQRRPVFTTLVAAGELGDGWGADDGAALVFAGTELEEVVASRPHASAIRVERTAGGGVDERRLPARYLGG
jgi:dipeptidase E